MKKTFRYLLLLGALTGFASCLDEVPYGTYSNETFYNTEADAESALMYAYVPINYIDYCGRFLFFLSDVPTNQYKSYGKADESPLFQWDITPTSDEAIYFFKSAYVSLARTNSVLENVSRMTSISAMARNRILGEAHFLRAFNHFMLVINYGSVPIRSKTVSTVSDSYKDFAPIEKIYGFIIGELEDVKKKYAVPRRTEIVYSHEMPEEPDEEPVEDYPVHLFLSREGYFKKITPQSLRMSGEQKFKEGDVLRQSFETTSNAEAMFFTDHCQVYKTRLGEFDDAKASVLGDYLPTKLKMDAGENVIFMVLPGADYAGSLLFFYENGKAARIEMKAYQTASNRRKLTGAYSDKSPLACIRRLDEDCELAVYSNEPRCLIFHTALLAPKTTRSAQGVAVMTLKPKYHLETVLLSEETSITNRTRYRVRAIPAAGALVKEEDSEDQQISLL